MKLKRLEIALIALTFAAACFTGGYFTGRKGNVNVVVVQPESTAAVASADIAKELPGSDPVMQLPGESAVIDEGNSYTVVDDAYSAETAVISDDDAMSEETAGMRENSGADAEENTEKTQIIGAPRGGDYRIININTASRAELTDLSGIGDVLAGRIVDYREQSGGFSKIEDIMKVSGIGEGRFAAIKDRIAVD